MKIITVENCNECPFSFYHIGLKGLRCKNTRRKHIEFIASIPDWCPLDEEKKIKRRKNDNTK